MKSLCLIVSIVAATLVAEKSATAQGGSSWKGEDVMPKRKSKDIKFGDVVNGRQTYFPLSDGSDFTVREERDGWLRIHDGQREGWVDKADFVLVNDAAAHFHRLVQANPVDTWALLMRGRAWQLKEEYDNAIKDYDECIRIDPTDDENFNARATAWVQKKEYDRAIKDYSEAIRLNPQNYTAYYNRARAWSHKNDHDRAIKDINEAIRLNPIADHYYRRAVLWFDKGEYDIALKDCTECIRLDPNNDVALHQRGRIWLTKNENDKAIRDFSEAIRLDPKYAAAYCNRGVAWSRKREYAQAIKDYDESIRLDPSDSFVFNSLAWLLATCPEAKYLDGKRAVELATKACELTKWKDSNAIDTLAAAYAETGAFDSAVKYQRQALLSPEFNGIEEGRQRLKLYEQKQPYRQK